MAEPIERPFVSTYLSAAILELECVRDLMRDVAPLCHTVEEFRKLLDDGLEGRADRLRAEEAKWLEANR